MNFYQNTEDDFFKHSCNICGKQLLTKKNLKKHQDVHKQDQVVNSSCSFENKNARTKWDIERGTFGSPR